MKPLILALGLFTLAACETIGFGTSVSLGSDGTNVTNTVSGSSGNVSGGVSIGL